MTGRNREVAALVRPSAARTRSTTARPCAPRPASSLTQAGRARRRRCVVPSTTYTGTSSAGPQAQAPLCSSAITRSGLQRFESRPGSARTTGTARGRGRNRRRLLPVRPRDRPHRRRTAARSSPDRARRSGSGSWSSVIAVPPESVTVTGAGLMAPVGSDLKPQPPATTTSATVANAAGDRGGTGHRERL